MDSSKFLSSFYQIYADCVEGFQQTVPPFFFPLLKVVLGAEKKKKEAVQTQQITGSHGPLIHHIHALKKCDYVPKEVLN